MKRRFLLFVTAMFVTMTAGAVDIWYSGGCQVVLNNGTLTVQKSGSGAMDNSTNPGWASKKGEITTINIKEGVTHIGNYAFNGCNNASLTSVTIPASVTSIGNYAFSGCYTLTSITFASGSNLTTIGNSAFSSCSSVTSLSIPANVTSIGDYAFSHCTSLSTLSFLGSNLTTIGYYAFMSCTNLSSVTIPASVTTLNNYAFNGCTNLATVSFGAGSTLSTIGTQLFENCSNLSSITLPNSVTTISERAFSHCTSLASFTIPSGVTSIGQRAFEYCSSLASITIPSGVTTIGERTFIYCSSLASISLPSGLTTIGSQAFYGCNSNSVNLTSLTIPASVTSIGNGAFSSCYLTAINVNENNSYYSSADGVMFDKDKTTLICCPAGKTGSYSVPASVTSISGSAFYGCSTLTSVKIPNGVTSIGNFAFDKCSNLTSLSIPSSVTSIGLSAFEYCSSLTSLTVYAPSCTLGSSPFYSANSGLKIYVFNDRLSTYKSASGWSSYKTKMEAITIPAREAKMGEYWTTYYNDLSNAKAPEGTQVFKVALSGSSLTLTEIDDRIINRGEGVVLKTTSGSILPEYAASGSATSYSDNDLEGTMTTITNPGNAYVLNYKAATGVGFYKLKSTGTIGAQKAYLTYAGASTAPEFLGFNETTGISNTDLTNGTEEVSNVFDLQGRRVTQPTKGLYIVNGKKVVIK